MKHSTLPGANPFAYGKPITLDTLDDLFAHHRSLTGGWRMEDDADADKGAGAGGSDADKDTFQAITSQADLDKVLGQRLAREREKFADYEALKTKAAEHDAAVEAAKTDAEKALEKAVADARKEGETAARSVSDQRIIKAEAKVAAAEMKFRNPAVALATIDLSGITVGDDGEVDTAAIKAKLTALATSDPYLVDDGKKGPRPDHSQGGGGGLDTPSVSRGQQMYEQARAARKSTGKAPTSL